MCGRSEPLWRHLSPQLCRRSSCSLARAPAQAAPLHLRATAERSEQRLGGLAETEYLYVDANARPCRQKNEQRQRRLREEAEELEYYRHAAGASGGEVDPLAPDSRVFARSAMSYGTVLAGGLAPVGRNAWRRVRLDGDGGDANCRVSELEPVVEWRDSGDGMLRVLARIAARDYDETGAPREPPRAASERVSRRVAGNDAAAPNDHQERETLSNGMIVGTLVVVFSPRIQTQGRRARIMGEKAGGWVEVRFIDDSTIASFRKYELRAPDQSARPALVPPSAHALGKRTATLATLPPVDEEVVVVDPSAGARASTVHATKRTRADDYEQSAVASTMHAPAGKDQIPASSLAVDYVNRMKQGGLDTTKIQMLVDVLKVRARTRSIRRKDTVRSRGKPLINQHAVVLAARPAIQATQVDAGSGDGTSVHDPRGA